MHSKEILTEQTAFSCERCGTCCNGMLVFLNAFDIERLLEISHWSNWLDFAELDEAEIKDCGDENFPVMIDGRMLFPVLKMQAESENCLFLGFEQGFLAVKSGRKGLWFAELSRLKILGKELNSLRKLKALAARQAVKARMPAVSTWMIWKKSISRLWLTGKLQTLGIWKAAEKKKTL